MGGHAGLFLMIYVQSIVQLQPEGGGKGGSSKGGGGEGGSVKGCGNGIGDGGGIGTGGGEGSSSKGGSEGGGQSSLGGGGGDTEGDGGGSEGEDESRDMIGASTSNITGNITGPAQRGVWCMCPKSLLYTRYTVYPDRLVEVR